MSRRFRVILVAVCALAVMGTTITAVSAQKGVGCGTGNLRCTDQVTDANGFWMLTGPDLYYVQISPSRGTFSFQQHGSGPAVIQHSTVLNIQLAGSSSYGFGCFVIPDSAFVVSKDLQTATLNATLTADEACPGFAQHLIPGTRPGQAAYPPGGGIPLPLQVSVTWTGPGAAYSSVSDTTSHCTGTTVTIHFSDRSSQARATGTLTLPDSRTIALDTTQFGFIESFDEALNQTGAPAPQCFFS